MPEHSNLSQAIGLDELALQRAALAEAGTFSRREVSHFPRRVRQVGGPRRALFLRAAEAIEQIDKGHAPSRPSTPRIGGAALQGNGLESRVKVRNLKWMNGGQDAAPLEMSDGTNGPLP